MKAHKIAVAALLLVQSLNAAHITVTSPEDQMKKVLIFTSSGGGGHMSVVKSISAPPRLSCRARRSFMRSLGVFFEEECIEGRITIESKGRRSILYEAHSYFEVFKGLLLAYT